MLLTLGRLPVSLHLARALHAQGFRVIVAEPFRFHLCRLSKAVDKSIQVVAPTIDLEAYLSSLQRIITEEDVSLVIPVSEEVMYVAALKNQLPAGVRMLCMDQQTLVQLHDKYEFFQLAQRHGVPVPQTFKADSVLSGTANLMADIVVKPRLSCSGMGVCYLSSAKRLTPMQKNDKYIVQQRMTGAACCSFSIAANGVVMHTVCYRSLEMSGSVSVSFEYLPVPARIAESVNAIVKATAYTGMISFDFMADEKGEWRAIECNPRATSGLHFLPFDVVYEALIKANSIAVETAPLADRLQEFWSCLTSVEAQLFKGKLYRSGWRRLFTTKDINWSWSDSKPFLLMSFILAPLFIKAIVMRTPMTELLMKDVGWHDV